MRPSGECLSPKDETGTDWLMETRSAVWAGHVSAFVSLQVRPPFVVWRQDQGRPGLLCVRGCV